MSSGVRRPRVAQVATFGLVGAAVALAAAEGGAYDIVVRQEAALVLWWLLALGAAVGVLPRTRPAAGGAVALGALALLGCWTALSLGWSSSAERTTTEVARVAAHLGVLVLVSIVLDRATWRVAVAGATAAAAGVCAYALGSRLHPGFLGSDDAIAGFVGGRRLSLPLNYWNAVGAWAGMTTALCLAWSAHARSAVVRGLALAAVPLSVVVSYLTYSRASLGGTVVGLLVLLLVSRNRWALAANGAVGSLAAVAVVLTVRGTPAIENGSGSTGAGKILLVLVAASLLAGGLAAALQRVGIDERRLTPTAARRVLVVVTLIAVVAGGVAGAALGPRAWRSFTKTRATVATSDPAARLTNLNGTRHLVWRSALGAFADHPLKGTGAGTFEFTWDRDARGAEEVKDAHSLYLEAMAELGLPGLLLVLALLGGAIAAVVRAFRRLDPLVDRGALAGASGAAAAFFFGAGVDWLWESTAVTVLALVLIGSVIAAGGAPAAPVRWPLRTLAVAACLVLCALQLPGLVATSEVRRSGKAVRGGDIAAGLEHASNAIDAEPWAATPYIQRALVEERDGKYDAARGDLVLARSRESSNWRISLLLARIDADRGAAAAAVADYRRARALRPLGRFFTKTR
jgi:hypothetical protein